MTTNLASFDRAIRNPGELESYRDGVAFIEGAYVPLRDGRISIIDSGFTHSDVTYDVVSVWRGKFFRLEDHLDRFERSAQVLRMHLSYDREEIKSTLLRMVSMSQLRDAYVSFMVTRGLPTSGSRDPREYVNQFYAFVCPYVWVFTPDQQKRGIRAVISSVERISPASVDPTVKNFHWGDLMRATWEAIDKGHETGILWIMPSI